MLLTFALKPVTIVPSASAPVVTPGLTCSWTMPFLVFPLTEANDPPT